MKGSSATSARATTAPRHTDPSSVRLPPTPISVDFVLTGRSELPDPNFNAYRRDLADIALAGQVIASHYAEPLARIVKDPVSLRSAATEEAPIIRDIGPGENFAMLDESIGWAWGYAGDERRVGYIPSEALSAP